MQLALSKMDKLRSCWRSVGWLSADHRGIATPLELVLVGPMKASTHSVDAAVQLSQTGRGTLGAASLSEQCPGRGTELPFTTFDTDAC